MPRDGFKVMTIPADLVEAIDREVQARRVATGAAGYSRADWIRQALQPTRRRKATAGRPRES